MRNKNIPSSSASGALYDALRRVARGGMPVPPAFFFNKMFSSEEIKAQMRDQLKQNLSEIEREGKAHQLKKKIDEIFLSSRK